MGGTRPFGQVRFLGLKTLDVIQERGRPDQVFGPSFALLAADGTELFAPPEGLSTIFATIPVGTTRHPTSFMCQRQDGRVFPGENPAGMMDALKTDEHDCIEDIVALCARVPFPGRCERNIPTFARVKNGHASGNPASVD